MNLNTGKLRTKKCALDIKVQVWNKVQEKGVIKVQVWNKG